MTQRKFDLPPGSPPFRHRLETDQCPPIPRVAEALRHGWTPEEDRHVQSCPHCLRICEIVRQEGVKEPAWREAARAVLEWVMPRLALPVLVGELASADRPRYREVREIREAPDHVFTVTFQEDDRELAAWIRTNRSDLAGRMVELELMGETESLIREAELKAGAKGVLARLSFGPFDAVPPWFAQAEPKVWVR